MDLHPLFVHFPIALLTLYAVLEILRPWTRGHAWQTTRSLLVIVGTLSAFVSLSTGEDAEHAYRNAAMLNVLEMHSLIATITTWCFACIAVCYAIELPIVIRILDRSPSWMRRALAIVRQCATTILTTPIVTILAILATLGLMLVGALGGILVYGPDFDPVTSLVYNLIFR